MRGPSILACFAAALAIFACSSSSAPRTSGTVSAFDAGGGDEGSASEAGVPDASDGGEAPLPTRKTSAEVRINDVARTLERAQFGLTKANDTLYVEAHEGGVAECPETETPKRTLIVNGVPKGTAGQTFTMVDGVTVSLVDFTGDQIEKNPPLTKATAATVTIVAIEGEASAEIEVDATFAEGTATGRIFATYCAAMDE